MLRASTLRSSDSDAATFLPVWSADGVRWHAVVVTRSCESMPEEFLCSVVYPTEDEAFEVAKRFCAALHVIHVDQERLDAGARLLPPGTILYESGNTAQLKLTSDAVVEPVPEVPDDGARDPHG